MSENRIRIGTDLEKAIGADYVPVTNGSGEQEYQKVCELHPGILSGPTLPTWNATTHCKGYEFIVLNEHQHILETYISDGTGWVLSLENHPDPGTSATLPAWSGVSHPVGAEYIVDDGAGTTMNYISDGVTGWIFVSCCKPDQKTTTGTTVPTWTTTDKEGDIFIKQDVGGNTLEAYASDGSEWVIIGTGDAINHPDVTTGLSSTPPTFDAAVHTEGYVYIQGYENGRTGNAYISNGSTWILMSEEAAAPQEGTSLPAAGSATTPPGTIFVVQDGSGNTVSTYVSGGGASYGTWIELGADTNFKTEILDTAFVDPANPLEAEVRTWVDANLTDLQKVNSRLYNIGGNIIREASFSYVQTSETITLIGNTTAVLDSIDINGTNYSIGGLNLKDPIDAAGIDPIIIAAFASEGITVTVNNTSSSVNSYLRFTPSDGVAVINGQYNYTTNAGTATRAFTNTPIATLTEITSTGTLYNPDFVWDITNDVITVLYDYRDVDYSKGYALGALPTYDAAKHNEGLVWYDDTTETTYVVTGGVFNKIGTEYSSISANIITPSAYLGNEDDNCNVVVDYNSSSNWDTGDYLELFIFALGVGDFDNAAEYLFVGDIQYSVSNADFTPSAGGGGLILTTTSKIGTFGVNYTYNFSSDIDVSVTIIHKDVNGATKTSEFFAKTLIETRGNGNKYSVITAPVPFNTLVKAPILTEAQRDIALLTDVSTDHGKIIYNNDTKFLEYWNGTIFRPTNSRNPILTRLPYWKYVTPSGVDAVTCGVGINVRSEVDEEVIFQMIITANTSAFVNRNLIPAGWDNIKDTPYFFIDDTSTEVTIDSSTSSSILMTLTLNTNEDYYIGVQGDGAASVGGFSAGFQVLVDDDLASNPVLTYQFEDGTGYKQPFTYDATAIQAEVTLNTTDRHTHANKTTLDKFGENGSGLPTYNGLDVDTTIAQRDVYDGLDSTDNTISLSANNGKVLKDVQDTQQTAINLNTSKISYTDATKVLGIETGADVTDTANVTAAGALMDSEVTNLAQVKSFDSSDYAAATHTHIASDVTDFDAEVSNNTSVALNTAKISFVDAPSNGSEYVRKDAAWAVSTGTINNYTSIAAPQLFNPSAGEVTANTGDYTLANSNTVAFVSLNGQVVDDSEYSLAGAVLTITPDNGFSSTADEILVFQHTFTVTGTDVQAAVALNTAKISFVDAPSDGQEYVRKDAAWLATSGAPKTAVAFNGAFYSNTVGADWYFPNTAENESASRQRYGQYTAPFDLIVKNIVVHMQVTVPTSGNLIMEIHDSSGTVLESVTKIAADYTLIPGGRRSVEFTFTSATAMDSGTGFFVYGRNSTNQAWGNAIYTIVVEEQ